MKIRILTEADLRRCISLDHDALRAVEDGFSALAQGHVEQPPIMRVDIRDNNGEVDVKTAYIKGKESFAIKVSSGFFDNHRLGLPSGSGLMMLFSTKTGVPQAMLLDNGYLTDVRTALAGAIAAKYLAPSRVRCVGVIGSGSQARQQVRALRLVRSFDKVLAYSRNQERVQRYVEEMGADLGEAVEVVAARSAEEVATQSDVIITTTPSREPVINARWLQPGVHITAMGSDAEDKQELDADVFAKASIVACDSQAQCFRLGELHHAKRAGVITQQRDIIEVGQLTSGQRAVQRGDGDISICDLTGTGVQDTAIALLAFERASAQSLGLEVDN